MTARNRPQSGERLVKLATILFDEPTRSTFVIPALADYQQELSEAGASAFKQVTAHVRGYAAFARLVLAAPFIVPSAPMRSPVTIKGDAPGRTRPHRCEHPHRRRLDEARVEVHQALSTSCGRSRRDWHRIGTRYPSGPRLRCMTSDKTRQQLAKKSQRDA